MSYLIPQTDIASRVQIVYVDTEPSLKRVVQQLHQALRVAIDVEFMRRETYYPKLALIQMAFDGEPVQYLIDPLCLDVTPLLHALSTSTCLKIMHACREDIQALFQQNGDVVFPNVLDTQIAAGYLSIGKQIGYKGLVKHYYGIELAKEEVCSDWLERPLSDSQLNYAALDVAFLCDIAGTMVIDLLMKGTYQYVLEDCALLIKQAHAAVSPDQYYLTFKQAHHFDQKRLQRLQKLCTWRERSVREADIPRARLLPDAMLFDLVDNNVPDSQALASITKTAKRSRNAKRLVNASLQQVLAQARIEPDVTLMSPLKPCDRSDKERLQYLYRCLDHFDEALDVPIDMLCSKRMIKSWLVLKKNNANDLEHPADVESHAVYFTLWRAFLDQAFSFIYTLSEDI